MRPGFFVVCLLVGCTANVPDITHEPPANVAGASATEALFGLPSWYPIGTICTTSSRREAKMLVADLNTFWGSDVTRNKTTAAVRAATQLRFRGEGEFECSFADVDWCGYNWPPNDRDIPTNELCSLSCRLPSLSRYVSLTGAAHMGGGHYRARIRTYEAGVGTHEFYVFWSGAEYRFEFDVCGNGRKDPAVHIQGSRGSSSTVNIAWGG